MVYVKCNSNLFLCVFSLYIWIMGHLITPSLRHVKIIVLVQAGLYPWNLVRAFDPCEFRGTGTHNSIFIRVYLQRETFLLLPDPILTWQVHYSKGVYSLKKKFPWLRREAKWQICFLWKCIHKPKFTCQKTGVLRMQFLVINIPLVIFLKVLL